MKGMTNHSARRSTKRTCTAAAAVIAVGASLIVGIAPASASTTAPIRPASATSADGTIIGSWISVAYVNDEWYLESEGGVKHFYSPTSRVTIDVRSTHAGTMVVEDEDTGRRLGSGPIAANTTTKVEADGLQYGENRLRLYVVTPDGQRTVDARIKIDSDLSQDASTTPAPTPPLTTEPVSETEPVTTEPVGDTEPVTTEPVSDTEPVTTEPVSDTEPVTTEPVGDTEPVTTVPAVDTEPGAGAPDTADEDAAPTAGEDGLEVVRWDRVGSAGINVVLHGEPFAQVEARTAAGTSHTQLTGTGDGIVSLRASDAFRWQVRLTSEADGRTTGTTVEIGHAETLVPLDRLAAVAVATPSLGLTTVRVAGAAGIARATNASGEEIASDWVDGTGSSVIRIRALPADLGPLTVTVDVRTAPVQVTA